MKTNWRGHIGSSINSIIHSVLSSSFFPLTRVIPRGSYWLYDIQRFAKNKNLKVIFDVGANTGQTLSGLLKYFPHSEIYCFEPVSSSFNSLKSVYGNRLNVSFYQKALGSSVGNMEISLHQNSELNTLVSDQPRTDDLTGKQEIISIDSADSHCAIEKINFIDILKIDVQGWELEVLKGAHQLIEKGHIRFIYAEVGFRHSDNDMQYFSYLNDHLEKCGFWFCGFYESFRWGPNKEFVGFANALYVNPEFRVPDVQQANAF